METLYGKLCLKSIPKAFKQNNNFKTVHYVNEETYLTLISRHVPVLKPIQET